MLRPQALGSRDTQSLTTVSSPDLASHRPLCTLNCYALTRAIPNPSLGMKRRSRGVRALPLPEAMWSSS